MGNMFLFMPSTEKRCESGSNGQLVYGLAEMQGWRFSMEDAHAVVLDLDGPGESSNAFFAVYDGHSRSAAAANYAGQNLHKRLVTEESYKERNWEIALKKAFLRTDKDLLTSSLHNNSGCCAVAALLTRDNKLYVANAGDSRSVLSVKGKVKPLSFDHKPTNHAERARIEGAGGYIWDNRVKGNLAMSRALGDFSFKKRFDLSPEAQIITADPEITCHEMTEEDEFLVLACDVSKGKELTEICEMIFEHCLAPNSNIRGADNMTLIVVGITHGRTKEGWYEWIKERVKNEYGYKTPGVPPQIYDQSHLKYFRARREEVAEKMKPTVTVNRPGGNIAGDSDEVMVENDDTSGSEDEQEDGGPK